LASSTPSKSRAADSSSKHNSSAVNQETSGERPRFKRFKFLQQKMQSTSTHTSLPLMTYGPERELSSYADELQRSPFASASSGIAATEYWTTHEHLYPLLM
jgi:hypothetical protein